MKILRNYVLIEKVLPKQEGLIFLLKNDRQNLAKVIQVGLSVDSVKPNDLVLYNKVLAKPISDNRFMILETELYAKVG